MKEGRYLVLLRHGYTEWNETRRFTGWTEVPLNDHGMEQAAGAGERLAESGLHFDEVHTSVLTRTHQTADRVLAKLGQTDVPRYATWRLNERHYGQLQGMSKDEIFACWGEQRSHGWWRGYFEAPPPLSLDDVRHPRFDPRYKELEAALLPVSESLQDCQRRVLPYWDKVVAPRLRAGRRILLISHGNTLRSLIMHLEQIAPEEIDRLEIPSGIPRVYQLDASLKMIEEARLLLPDHRQPT